MSEELFPNIIGEVPYNPVQQAYADTCAIKSQQLIMNEFGIPVTEDQCVEYSINHGWYNGNGTSFEDVGKLLADAGIPCTQRIDSNIFDLVNELQQGHKVIVGVDSGELWSENSIWESIKEWFEDLFNGDIPDHALIVAGIDMTDPNNPMVILTDPGTGEAARTYPLDKFMDAWADSQHFMVSTDIPTTEAITQFQNADITDGHLPEIAGVDYDVFTDFLNYSHQIDFSQFLDLYTQFDMYPTVADWNSFNDVLTFNSDLFTTPYIQPAFDPTISYVDPYANLFAGFDFSLPDTNIISDTNNHTIDKLTDLYDDAMTHYQDCIDHGMYISATQWQMQANDIQSEIDNLNYPL